jgi:LemA protein
VPIAAAVVVVLLVLGGAVLAVRTQNRLVEKRNAIRDAWAGIDVQLTKRADLVPSLVAVVKGYAAHEAGTLDAVIQARTGLLHASDVPTKAVADGALAGSLAGVMALQEAYPDLKANESFTALQTQLTRTEDDLAAARRYYNGCVKSYEDIRSAFPANLVAARLHFHREAYFQP